MEKLGFLSQHIAQHIGFISQHLLKDWALLLHLISLTLETILPYINYSFTNNMLFIEKEPELSIQMSGLKRVDLTNSHTLQMICYLF